MNKTGLHLSAIRTTFGKGHKGSIPCFHTDKYGYKQELSYRQQIARQLRTQYAEGIYRLKYYTVTLKSRLRVTEGQWKRNH